MALRFIYTIVFCGFGAENVRRSAYTFPPYRAFVVYSVCPTFSNANCVNMCAFKRKYI